MERRSHIYGVMGEFATPEQLTHAVEKVREAGYHRLDAYAPFPVEGLSQALGLKLNLVPLKAQKRQVNVAMSNSFGFGGTNAALILSKL